MSRYTTRLRVTDTKQVDIGVLVRHTDTMRQPDPFISWAREHRRLSTGTIRRRFQVSIEEADTMLAYLLRERVLHPVPEGDSYQVRYPQMVAPERWLHPDGQTYRYNE